MEELEMINIPKMKVGIVAVSRDCFPESLSVNRRKALVEAYAKKYDAADIYECPVCIVESEIHMKILRKQDVTHFAYTLETSALKSPKHYLQSILTDLRCSLQQAKKIHRHWQAAVVMHTAVC